MIDLRSDLLAPRPSEIGQAFAAALRRAPSMAFGEDPDERALSELLEVELGMEAVVFLPTCTMANQIAIRLHLPSGGRLASAPLSHIVTVEARATALTGARPHPLPAEAGHPTPEGVEAFLATRDADDRALVWLENTQMLAAGSVMPAGWQRRIGAACRRAGCALHLDGSRLWNAAVANDLPMRDLADGVDTVALSLNKAIGAPLGSVLAGDKALIDEAVAWRAAMGGEWRPLGPLAAAARVALGGWRERLELDALMTERLARVIAERLGPDAVQPAPTNLIFLNRPRGDASRFVEALGRCGVGAIAVGAGAVRLAIHSGVREREVTVVAHAVSTAHAELAAAA